MKSTVAAPALADLALELMGLVLALVDRELAPAPGVVEQGVGQGEGELGGEQVGRERAQELADLERVLVVEQVQVRQEVRVLEPT